MPVWGVDQLVGREQPHSDSIAIDGAIPLLRYERELTVGSVGTLWLGRLAAGTEAGRTVLLRRMSLDLFSTRDIESLLKIAEAYAKVRHPSLVKLLGLIEQDRDIVSISEHLDGVRLSDLLRNCIDKDLPLPPTVAVRIVLDAARATVKAHRLAAESGLFPVERLFLPEAVFVAAFGGTLLTETGVLSSVARCAEPRNCPDLLAQLAPEEFGKTATTPGSPEVFSFGVLLWELLANRWLFTRDRTQQTLDELQNQPIATLDQVERNGMPVPESLAEIVQVATARQLNQRYGTVDQLVTALERLPAHFIATEHHVAAALRDQAAELLEAFHLDSSQSSLTLAFSEVPASRLSTCPPPEGHNWEPPTFAQRKLLSSVASVPKIPEANVARLPSLGVVSTSSSVPESPRQSLRFNRIGWLVVAAVMVAATIATVRFIRLNQARGLRPDVQTTHLETSQPDDAEPHPGPAGSLAPPEPIERLEPPRGAPAPVDASGDRSRVPKHSSIDVPAASVSAGAAAAPMAPKSSGAAFRPRQIAPYRPKGI